MNTKSNIRMETLHLFGNQIKPSSKSKMIRASLRYGTRCHKKKNFSHLFISCSSDF